MSIIDRVKNHVSENRGKYSVATGVGAAYGASKLPDVSIPAGINQAGFNILAKGQNLALDAADKIGYGKEQLQNLGVNRIDPDVIDGMNKAINNMDQLGLVPANAMNLTNGAEKLTELKNNYNNTIAQAKENYQNFSNDLDNKASGYIDQGVNFVKGLNPFHENTLVNKINIKSLLLEGYSPEVIVEAIHTNHPTLDKNKPENKINRMLLKDDIQSSRTQRDMSRSNAKKYENLSKKITTQNNPFTQRIKDFNNSADNFNIKAKETLNKGIQ